MPHMLVIQQVESYAKWRPTFDALDDRRAEHGVIGTPFIFRSGDDPWQILILLELEDLEQGRQFAASSSFKEKMCSNASESEPQVYFLNQV